MLAFPAPTDVMQAASEVVPHVLAGKITTREGAQAGWILVGYAADVALPDNPNAITSPLTNEMAASYLQQAANPQAVVALPWGQIAGLLIPLLLKWIQSRGQ